MVVEKTITIKHGAYLGAYKIMNILIIMPMAMSLCLLGTEVSESYDGIGPVDYMVALSKIYSGSEPRRIKTMLDGNHIRPPP